MIAFGIQLFVSFVIGYIVCHFIIAPIFIRKHMNKSIYEAFVYEGLQAEITLKNLEPKVNDKGITNTLKLIQYSKYSILFSLILFIIFCVLNVVNQ